MTDRKPPGVSFESWVDKQIREATERGDFDDLPGAGKPLPGLDGPYEESWWVKEKMRRENVSFLPPALALRKEAEEALDAASHAASEAEVRRIVTAVNEKIRAAIRTPPDGPPLNLAPIEADRAVREWREQRGGPGRREHGEG